MSSLPHQLDPWRLADQGRYLEGAVALADMPRVAGLLPRKDGEARFKLEFYRDEKRRPCLKGFVKTVVTLRCQRCLEPVDVEVDAELLLCVVESPEAAAALPDAVDAYLLDGDGLDPLQVLEDEILLALPQIPKHDAAECAVALDDAPGEPAEPAADNPFQVLAQLKNRIH